MRAVSQLLATGQHSALGSRKGQGAERVRVLGEAVLLCIHSLAPSCAEAALDPGESLPCGRRHTRLSACNTGRHETQAQLPDRLTGLCDARRGLRQLTGLTRAGCS